MLNLTDKDEQTIREFLRWCLNDGLYAFEIDGEIFLLETSDDVEKISTAILLATPPVKHYRLSQAKQWLNSFETAASEDKAHASRSLNASAV